MKHLFKWGFGCFIAIILLYWILRVIILHVISYEVLDYRYDSLDMPEHIKKELRIKTQNCTIEQISNICLKETAKMCTFSFNQTGLFQLKVAKAHCVTYSKLYTEMCNYCFRINNINANAKHVVGYVKIGNINLCQILQMLFPKNKNLVKDHDFVLITHLEETYYVDPSLYDMITLIY
ncbi:MAG: hypothetical protein ACI30B_03660 [Paludibacteraceae bacterium]